MSNNAAPSVLIDVTPCPLWRAGLGLAAGATTVGMLAWARQHAHNGLDPATLAGVVAVTLGALVAAAQVLRAATSPQGTLLWNSHGWQWRGQAGALRVAIDLGAWMLLRFSASDGAGPALWLPVRQRQLGHPRWHALHCALQQRPTRHAPLSGPICEPDERRH